MPYMLHREIFLEKVLGVINTLYLLLLIIFIFTMDWTSKVGQQHAITFLIVFVILNLGEILLKGGEF